MTVSVCMCTYNGETYIEEQLRSIMNQTYMPDEVVICDDASQDHTAEIIGRFIRENNLASGWRLCTNTENRGYPGNFYYAMSLCKGDLVFLSDQDDIWHKNKLEHMREVFQQYPEIQVLCCKFGLIDREGTDIHSVMAPAHSAGTGRVSRISVESVFYKCEWPGMVIGYRTDWYRRRAMKLAAEAADKIPHDLLLCALAAEENTFAQMDEELAYHRRHNNNSGGEEHRIGKLLNKARKLREIREYLRILDAFEEGHVLDTEYGNRALSRKKLVMEGRQEALRSGKIGRVICWAWKNRKDVRLATALCDLLIVKQETA